jgi:hypothetical protein
MDWTAGVLFPAKIRDHVVRLSVQNGSRAQSVSYTMSRVCFRPDIKRPGREAGHLPSPRVEIKNGGIVHAFSHKSSWPGA